MIKVRFKKLRLWLAYPFAAWAIFVFYKSDFDLRFGIWFIILGMAIRFWAAGFIKKRRVLTTAGPYAYTRNPLYLGSFLTALGFCLFVKDALLISVFCGLFLFLYFGTMREEEELLAKLFGPQYLEYKKAVPVFFPSLKGYKTIDRPEFNLKQAYLNGEFIRVLVVLVLLFTLYFFKKDVAASDNFILFACAYIMVWMLFIFSILHRRSYMLKKNDSHYSST